VSQSSFLSVPFHGFYLILKFQDSFRFSNTRKYLDIAANAFWLLHWVE